MNSVSEKLTVLIKAQYIAVRIYSCLVYLIYADKLVSYLIRRIGKHEHYLLCAHCDTAQADSKTVT